MKRFLFTLTLCVAFTHIADAQSFYSRRRDRTNMFSYGLGAAQYHGDLHDILYDGMSTATGYSLGIGYRKRFGKQFSVRFDFNHYQIGGTDADVASGGIVIGRKTSSSRVDRNLSFRSRNFEFSAQAHINLIPIKGSYMRRPAVNPYLIAGIGWTTVNTKAELDGEWYLLRDYKTEYGYAAEGAQNISSAFVIPLGFGIRFRANQFIDVLIEGARRFTFTDYLDDVSTFYPSQEALLEAHGGDQAKADIAYRLSNRRGELEGKENYSPGELRGNPNKNDAYYIFQVRLEMYLPDNILGSLGKRRKPKFR